MRFPAIGRSAVALAALAICSAAMTARADETWQALLKMQLDTERKCQFESMVYVRELPVENLGGLEGRVRCADGREFDFSRQKLHQKFELHLCQPAVC